ncbi:Potassium channel sub K member 9 [Homalodisca vitripennis]|nr:Potassium channel sub K member 9 [Homalodisca vitripennis]
MTVFCFVAAIEKMIIKKYNISPDDFRVMETVVLKAEPHKAGQQWKFAGAFYYATTVLTTIGCRPIRHHGAIFVRATLIIIVTADIEVSVWRDAEGDSVVMRRVPDSCYHASASYLSLRVSDIDSNTETTYSKRMRYGHSTPNTVGGKLFTMCYAIVGIPLGLVMFQSIGERLNKFSSVVIRNVKRLLRCKNVEASEINLICVVMTLSSLTIAGGAAAFSRYEGWTYFDSVYYCFITLTTIGFGDMVALQKDNALDKKPEYVAFALIFILFGLAIVAASLNLLVLRFVTMNTEDERRDEAEALQSAKMLVVLQRVRLMLSADWL